MSRSGERWGWGLPGPEAEDAPTATDLSFGCARDFGRVPGFSLRSAQAGKFFRPEEASRSFAVHEMGGPPADCELALKPS